ncbi:MAG TPA: hypothetical protein VGS22_16250 [Thermoanaerobaculia bacterium]|jgi:transcriptional regulator with XRE-family HTH domain|nr:hypothetical protein [Thermoanaerobaculia bacterium]
MSDPRDRELDHLLLVLQTVIGASGQSRRSIEQRLGLTGGHLSKILHGVVDLKVRHVLWLCDALGMTPVRFFQIATATAGARSQGEILEKVSTAGAGLNVASAEGSDPKELEELVLQSMRKILREALGGTEKPG